MRTNEQEGTSEELKEKFIKDYLNYYNESSYSNDYFATKIHPHISDNQKIFHYGSKDVVATYDDNRKLIGIQTYDVKTSNESYNDVVSRQNIRAEADATARFHLFLNKLRALNYPVYNTNGIISPKVYLKIGGDNGFGGLRLKGYCTTSINYDGLTQNHSYLTNQQLNVCDKNLKAFHNKLNKCLEGNSIP